jgi:hypothetical protein
MKAKKKSRTATDRNVASYDGPVPGRYRPAAERKGGPFDDYEIRDALQTLAQAAKIQSNSALMRAVRKEARKQLAAAQSTNKALNGE